MALSPLSTAQRVSVERPTAQPARTFGFDFDTLEFTGLMIDGQVALQQFILKALRTVRYRSIIYSGQYGSEVEMLIGQDLPIELLNVEVPRMIKESLIFDDRIKDVTDFTVFRDGPSLYAEFTVIPTIGTEIPMKAEVS